jgi:hypothetical protein
MMMKEIAAVMVLSLTLLAFGQFPSLTHVGQVAADQGGDSGDDSGDDGE